MNPLIDAIAGARVFDLEQPRFAGMPIHPAHQPGYFYALHRRHRDTYRPDAFGPRSGSSGVLTMMEHSGTHIDALCHQARDLKFHGDVRVDDVERSDGFKALGAAFHFHLAAAIEFGCDVFLTNDNQLATFPDITVEELP